MTNKKSNQNNQNIENNKRSLGLSLIFAGSDLLAFKKTSNTDNNLSNVNKKSNPSD